MTVPGAIRRYEYACDGSNTSWPIEFSYIDVGTIKVSLIAQDGTESEITNKTVLSASVIAPAGGDAYAAGNKVRIERVMTYTQLDDYTSQGKFSPEDMERTADKMIMISQQIRDISLDTEAYVNENLPLIKRYKDDAETSKNEAVEAQSSALDASVAANLAMSAAENAQMTSEALARQAAISAHYVAEIAATLHSPNGEPA